MNSQGFIWLGDRSMNKTLIVLGAGIWGVIILLRFVPMGIDTNTEMLFNILEIVAFIITVVGIIRRD